MKINIRKRPAERKCEAKQIRRKGNIPAIVYAEGKEGETIEVDGAQFQAVLRKLKKGYLPTTVFSLQTEKGEEIPAIVKDIQYHVTTYDIEHLDFERLIDDVKVKVKVPIRCEGAAECAGVKLGGVVRQVIRHLPVQCLPKNIPSDFALDIRELAMSQSKRLNAITVPAEVRPLVDMNEVAVLIVKR